MTEVPTKLLLSLVEVIGAPAPLSCITLGFVVVVVGLNNELACSAREPDG